MNLLKIEDSAPIEQKAALYKQVFGEAPWNEGFICNACGTMTPTSFGRPSACGECRSTEVREYYDDQDLTAELASLKARDGYAERVASILDQGLVGFAWGWEADLPSLNRDKLDLPEDRYAIFSQAVTERFPEYDGSPLYYFAEIGVSPGYRGMDIAGRLYRSKMEAVRDSGKKYTVLRTTRASEMPFRWFLNNGFEVVFEYGDDRDRVIMMKAL